MKFQPLSEILKGMGSEFIDKDCQKQCFQTAGTSYVAKKDGSIARKGKNYNVIKLIFINLDFMNEIISNLLSQTGVTNPNLAVNSGSDFCTKKELVTYPCGSRKALKINDCRKLCSAGLPR